jgi:surfactin synthase thioesterase subunit
VGKEEDEIEAENVHGWMMHTRKVCTICYFNGGHFFINDEVETLAEIMSRKLTEGLYISGNQGDIALKALR